jgi:hypothetical protein
VAAGILGGIIIGSAIAGSKSDNDDVAANRRLLPRRIPPRTTRLG